MYVHKFPGYKYSIARFGTIASRLRDCTTLTEVHYIHETLCIKFKELGKWIWHDKLARQLLGILKRDEETENEFSYLLYMMDFQQSHLMVQELIQNYTSS